MDNKNTYSTAFLLRTAKAKKGKAPIYCRITVNGQRIEFSLKRSVSVTQWNNGRIKGNDEEARTLKAYLKQVEAKLFEHYRNLLADSTLVTPDTLKNAYLGLETGQYSLLELMDYHNNQLKDGLEWGTMKNYFTTQNYVKQFLEQRLRKKDIYLSQLSYQFITELEMYLWSSPVKVDTEKSIG